MIAQLPVISASFAGEVSHKLQALGRALDHWILYSQLAECAAGVLQDVSVRDNGLQNTVGRGRKLLPFRRLLQPRLLQHSWQSNGDLVKAWEWDWRRAKGKNKAPSAVFAARDRWKYLSSLPGCCSGEGSRHIRDGVATSWAHGAAPSALSGAVTGRVSGSQGCVPPVPRKGSYRHISILKCMKKTVLRPASFWHYTALHFIYPERKSCQKDLL